MSRRSPIRVGYEYMPGRITYWLSFPTFTNIRQARYWAKRLNRHELPGKWVVRV